MLYFAYKISHSQYLKYVYSLFLKLHHEEKNLIYIVIYAHFAKSSSLTKKYNKPSNQYTNHIILRFTECYSLKQIS